VTYIQIKTLRNLIVAGMTLVVGYCLQWAGMATLSERMNDALLIATLSAYDWSAGQSALVQMVYQIDIWYWRTLAEVSRCLAIGGLLVVFGIYQFFSVRAAAVATILAIVGTFALSAPSTLTDAFWLSSTGRPSPMIASVTADGSKASADSETSGEAERSLVKVPADLWSESPTILPLGLIAYGVSGATVLFNAVRLALIPVIVFAICGVLIGSRKRYPMPATVSQTL
jgi:hypothetical protein